MAPHTVSDVRSRAFFASSPNFWYRAVVPTACNSLHVQSTVESHIATVDNSFFVSEQRDAHCDGHKPLIGLGL